MSSFARSAFVAMALTSATVSAGSIADIKNVVIFMQENRAFDHYFGTMAGVRGFKDPNVQVNSGTPVWYQVVDQTLSNTSTSLLPFYMNYLGGTWENATQCSTAGSNGWTANHAALNGDLNNHWATGNTPWSWGHFTRKELPNHFAIAEGWTVGDMYQESVIASTNPNRVSWVSGTVQDESSVYIDNNETPGCDSGITNCYPLTWKTTVEMYQEQGVSWQLYQDTNNFDDNPLAWFKQFQNAANGSDLNTRGMSFVGLEKFYEDAAKGTLPEVSIIVGPAELSEHPPYQPKDGAWLQQKIVDVVTSSPSYESTALIISYDETGGWGDHVTPYHSPSGTPIEWIQDPYGEFGNVYTGPGFRLPFYIISPWTRGGHVYTEHADHASQIKFIEQWQLAKGKNVTLDSMAPWRRQNMADLTKAFDFEHPDFSVPSMPNASYPSTDSEGNWNGYAVCESTYPIVRPPVPYGQQNIDNALATEQGFKCVRGQLTEGRYLTFEMNGYALTASNSTNSTNSTLIATKATAKHDSKAQRFVIHQSGSSFTITAAPSGSAIYNNTSFTIKDRGNGKGYILKRGDGQYLAIDKSGHVAFQKSSASFSIFSVTYDK